MDTKEIFKKLFPQPTATFAGRSGSEVNGLPKGTVPQNCEIVTSGMDWSERLGRQEHYLVRVEGALVFLRVCSAAEGSGYDEFAVIREVAFSERAQAELEAYARDSIKSICRTAQPKTSKLGWDQSRADAVTAELASQFGMPVTQGLKDFFRAAYSTAVHDIADHGVPDKQRQAIIERFAPPRSD